MPERTLAIICDFDDTIAEVNVAEIILKRFGGFRWQELRRQHREKLIPFWQYQETAFREVTAGPDEMKAYIRKHVALRTGFSGLWRECQANATPLAVVTLGLDFYVAALLEREGLSQMPTYAVGTTFLPNGPVHQYDHNLYGCTQWGNCKCSALDFYRRLGYNIAYVGDGLSDFCPASKSDLVFAHKQLESRCLDEGVLYLHFDDFRDVVAYMKRKCWGETV
jgi:2-hydroxy-3-keto-5-methylthiopentenyl-1-phosphate phosphatase